MFYSALSHQQREARAGSTEAVFRLARFGHSLETPPLKPHPRVGVNPLLLAALVDGFARSVVRAVVPTDALREDHVFAQDCNALEWLVGTTPTHPACAASGSGGVGAGHRARSLGGIIAAPSLN